MIMPKYLEEKVMAYCRQRNYNTDKLSEKEQNDVRMFIKNLIRNSRARTKQQEYDDNLKIDIVDVSIALGVNYTKYESPIEYFFDYGLKKHGIDSQAVMQHQIGTKRVDFAFPDAMLVVECDGKQYHFTDQSQIDRDQKRDKYLARRGWRVLHIEGKMIRTDIDYCVELVKKELQLAKG